MDSGVLRPNTRFPDRIRLSKSRCTYRFFQSAETVGTYNTYVDAHSTSCIQAALAQLREGGFDLGFLFAIDEALVWQQLHEFSQRA